MKTIDLPVPELLAGLAEECSELAQAALKLRRVHTQINPTPARLDDAYDDLCEEIADVLLYLDQISYPVSYVFKIKEQKLERWKKRMEGRKDA